MKLKDGDNVFFQITGNVGAYKGVVKTVNGYNNRPELRVTHLQVNQRWVHIERTRPWPILKDGDYILMTEPTV